MTQTHRRAALAVGAIVAGVVGCADGTPTGPRIPCEVRHVPVVIAGTGDTLTVLRIVWCPDDGRSGPRDTVVRR